MFKFNSRTNRILFITILVVAALLRLAFLSRGMIYMDESAYIYRGADWVDTLRSGTQKTPVDLMKDLPWWTDVSFHDHPPLTFAINHIVIRTLGYNLFVGRLPSALLGLASVFLVFLIAKKVFKRESLALMAMAVFAVSNLAVHYSRNAMMESMSLFFILLASYIFLLSLKNSKLLPWFGVILGLSFLAKYTAFVMIPVYFLILLFYKREYFKDFRLYLAGFLALVFFSPVIVYNIELYRAWGHFDVQFASLFGQNTPNWTLLLGKDQRGTILNRMQGWASLIIVVSPLFLYTALSGLFVFLIKVLWKRQTDLYNVFLLLSFFAFLSMTLLFGAHSRFLFYLLPFLSILLVVFLQVFLESPKKYIKFMVLIIFLTYEMVYCLSSVFMPLTAKSIGLKYITYTDVFYRADSGARNLDLFFQKELEDKAPSLHSSYLPKKISSRIRPIFKINGKSFFGMLVYDDRMDYRSLSWTFIKRIINEDWFAPGIGNYERIMDKSLSDAYYEQAVVYYTTTLSDLSREASYRDDVVKIDLTAMQLINAGASSTIIYNNAGLPAFRVFYTNVKGLNQAIKDRNDFIEQSKKPNVITIKKEITVKGGKVINVVDQ
ncbi:MAG: glycosyltransferase family 39 protein [bacterium]